MTLPTNSKPWRGGAAIAVALLLLTWAGVRHPALASAQSPARPAAPPATAAPGSCKSCHAALITTPVVHPPAADDCATCHQQQGTAHKFKSADVGELCSGCHETMKPSDKFVHGPVATGDCVSCHNPHGAAAPKLLRATGAKLCETCHVEMRANIAQHRYTHSPVQTNCTGCHDPHASPNRFQLRASGGALCFTCHTAIQQRAGASPVKHEALTSGHECLNCHDPHTSDIKPQLRATTKTLCLSCHDRELMTPTGQIQNIKAWLDSNPNMHGPIREGDCTACHKPHESEHFRLLRQDYPVKFYSGFDPANYELCFNCHQPDLVRVEKTTTLTGFRDGDRNLHFLHVNRPEKGRTCRACHEVHSSTRPKHIRDKVPFGAWALPIKYESAQNGGKCSPGCHMPQQYTRTPSPAVSNATPKR